MAKAKLDVTEVRARFTAIGHVPTFEDADYTGAFAKLDYVCGNCGTPGQTTTASVTSRMKNGDAMCPSCGHSKGGAAAKDSAMRLDTSVGKLTLAEIAERFGVSAATVKSRHQRGWSPDEVCGITRRAVSTDLTGRTGTVYGWWCKERGMCVYVGLTLQRLNTRTQRHFADADNGSAAPLHAYIRQMGADNFEIRKLWSGDAADVQRKEVFYIKKHRTSVADGGLNQQLGGSVGCQGGTSVEYMGVAYRSLKELWRKACPQIAYTSLLGRLESGLTLEQAVCLDEESAGKGAKRRRAVTVDGVTYSSVSDLWEKLGRGRVQYATLTKRMRNGMGAKEALELT